MGCCQSGRPSAKNIPPPPIAPPNDKGMVKAGPDGSELPELDYLDHYMRHQMSEKAEKGTPRSTPPKTEVDSTVTLEEDIEKKIIPVENNHIVTFHRIGSQPLPIETEEVKGPTLKEINRAESAASNIQEYSLTSDPMYLERRAALEEKETKYKQLQSLTTNKAQVEINNGKFESKYLVLKKLSMAEGICIFGKREAVRRALGMDKKDPILKENDFDNIEQISGIIDVRCDDIINSRIEISTRKGTLYRIKFKDVKPVIMNKWYENLKKFTKFYKKYKGRF